MTITIPLEIIISILIGAALCFFGYRLKKVAFAVIWFMVGYFAVKTYFPHIIEDQFWQTVLQIGVGALLSLIGLTIEKLAVAGTAAVVVASFVLSHFGPATDWVLPAIAITAGVVAGAVAVSLMKPAVIIFTAIFGADLLASVVISFIPDAGSMPYLSLIIFAVLAVVGISFQFNNTKHIE